MNKIRNTQARIHSRMLARGTRGVSMLEYVLIAAVVIGLGIILKTPLENVFNKLKDNLASFNS